VECAVIVGTITGNGNATFTMTMAGMTGSPLATSVAVLQNDTPDTVATKAVTALNAVANFNAKCVASCSGANLYITALLAAANDATMNMAYTNGTCAGLTPDATSDNTRAGVDAVNVAQVTNISGPGMTLDTEDVTTHDQATAFEEVVATVLRSGEVTLDIEYDPNEATHSASAGGLIDYKENKIPVWLELTFPGAVVWQFPAFITGFEPGAPHDGALTASVTAKISGAPTLA